MLSPKRMSVIVLSSFVILTLGIAQNAQAQIQEVKVEIKGLSCPFCVKGIEKHLKKVEGVTDVSTSLKKGEVILHYKPQTSFDLKSIESAVVRGGFTPGAVTLSARGKVSRKNENFLFTITGTKSSFLLYSSDPTEGHNAEEMVSEKAKTELDQADATHQSIEISGRVHGHENGRPGLSVEQMKTVVAENKNGE